MIVKGCNRDTAWYSIIDEEWLRLRGGFEQWLAVDNFDEHGASAPVAAGDARNLLRASA
jgi:hypothetical protein